MASKCKHIDKLDYAKGLCQICYYKEYNGKVKRALKAKSKADKETEKDKPHDEVN
jgi:hypothetical protein